MVVFIKNILQACYIFKNLFMFCIPFFCLAPTGFAINGNFSTVNLTIFEMNANTSDGYQVLQLTSMSLTYNACLNHVKDGTETGFFYFLHSLPSPFASIYTC